MGPEAKWSAHKMYIILDENPVCDIVFVPTLPTGLFFANISPPVRL